MIQQEFDGLFISMEHRVVKVRATITISHINLLCFLQQGSKYVLPPRNRGNIKCCFPRRVRLIRVGIVLQEELHDGLRAHFNSSVKWMPPLLILNQQERLCSELTMSLRRCRFPQPSEEQTCQNMRLAVTRNHRGCW
jgi:hypothetical protein